MKFVIPMDENERLEYLDKDSNITYLIRPIIGETEIQSQDIMSMLRTETDNIKSMKLIDQLFNIFVTGWRSTNKLPEFPSDNNPSRFFPFAFKNDMINIAYRLSNLSDDEKKN